MRCECDRFKHEHEPCPFDAVGVQVVSSPALCIGCLFYCWADD